MLRGRGLRRVVLRALAGSMLVPLAAITPSSAQDSVSRPVIQPLPDANSVRLGEALRALAQAPQSADALVEAGLASLALDDLEAALGFLSRAQAIAPEDPRIKAGIGAALARQGQPLPALKLFAEAEKSGLQMTDFAGDRGLAFDLVGDNASAQEQYRLALAQGEDAAISRRLAISQAIAGDKAASEATLLPMLQRQDLSAYRARAFALAILGQADEAVSIAETLLPAQLSGRMGPYLRFMPRLTPAQQAAAANLGRFPQAADIGKDDPEIVALASRSGTASPKPVVAAGSGAVDARLVPGGEPFGKQAEPAALAPQASDKSVRRRVARTSSGAGVKVDYTPEVPEPAESNQAAPALAEADRQVAELPPKDGQVAELPPKEAPEPSFSLAQSPAGPPAELPAKTQEDPAPAPAPAETGELAALQPAPEPPVEQAAEEVSLEEAFADFERPAGVSRPAVGPAAGAVDITAIEPVREKPKPPPPPPEPSRHWVQVATGRNVSALGFDWRRIKRKAGDLLSDAKPYIASWGRTNRLVTGPYPSTKDADEAVRELKAKGLDSFRFTSDEGEKVRELD